MSVKTSLVNFKNNIYGTLKTNLLEDLCTFISFFELYHDFNSSFFCFNFLIIKNQDKRKFDSIFSIGMFTTKKKKIIVEVAKIEN